MATVVKLPKCGINMEFGTVTCFLVKEGDHVVQDQPVAELETDKNTTEITAPEEGYVLKLLCAEHEELPILTPVMALGENGEVYEPESKTAVDTPVKSVSAAYEENAVSAQPASIEFVAPTQGERVKASPLAKKIAAELRVDLREVTGSGPEGGIFRRDVLAFAATRSKLGTPTPARYVQPAWWDLPVKKRIPLKGMRRAISENMSRSKAIVPHFNLTTSIDMTEAIALRSKLREQCGIKVSYNDILAKAIAGALENNPVINSTMGDGEILQLEPVNIGVAVGLDNGLIVPVITDVDKKSLREVAQQSAALIRSAREGRLAPNACMNGTITISNLGMYEVDQFTAIVNMPESCILAVGKIEKRPIVIGDDLVIRPMMNITASFDHRIIDGAVGAQFMTDLKHRMQNPFTALVQ